MSDQTDLHTAARYRRNLGSLGPGGQGRLFSAHVLVAGLGGLGGYIAEQLAHGASVSWRPCTATSL